MFILFAKFQGPTSILESRVLLQKKNPFAKAYFCAVDFKV